MPRAAQSGSWRGLNTLTHYTNWLVTRLDSTRFVARQEPCQAAPRTMPSRAKGRVEPRCATKAQTSSCSVWGCSSRAMSRAIRLVARLEHLYTLHELARGAAWLDSACGAPRTMPSRATNHAKPRHEGTNQFV